MYEACLSRDKFGKKVHAYCPASFRLLFTTRHGWFTVSPMSKTADFQHLVPETMLMAVEKATGRRMSGLATPLPSYVNRVYEVQTADGDLERLICKFYRPGRWSKEALQKEIADLEAQLNHIQQTVRPL